VFAKTLTNITPDENINANAIPAKINPAEPNSILEDIKYTINIETKAPPAAKSITKP
jgi:hypothetical protein